jgi:hypothetical protein
MVRELAAWHEVEELRRHSDSISFLTYFDGGFFAKRYLKYHVMPTRAT